MFCNVYQQPSERSGQPQAANEALRFKIRSNKATDPLTHPFHRPPELAQ